jgi:hypothetical protein
MGIPSQVLRTRLRVARAELDLSQGLALTALVALVVGMFVVLGFRP